MFSGKGVGVLRLLAECFMVCVWSYLGLDALRQFALAAPDHKPEIGPAIIALALGGLTAYAIHRRIKGVQEDRRFTQRLVANADKIRNGDPVFYRKERIYPATELVRHHTVFSVIVMSFRSQTRWLIKGREPRFNHALGATLYTLCYGWWGFPFGIFWTLVAIVKNIKGSTVVRVADLLQPVPAKPQGFNERFQADFGKRMRAGFFIDESPKGILPAEPTVKV